VCDEGYVVCFYDHGENEAAGPVEEITFCTFEAREDEREVEVRLRMDWKMVMRDPLSSCTRELHILSCIVGSS
jgi:hypothetical protein